jgi:hypothetical protein
MAVRILVFGKYPVTRVLQTVFRKGWSKEKALKALTALGHGDVAPNTITTQYTDCKNQKYAKPDLPFDDAEWDQLEKASNGIAEEKRKSNGNGEISELLRFKKVADEYGGTARVRELCNLLDQLR